MFGFFKKKKTKPNKKVEVRNDPTPPKTELEKKKDLLKFLKGPDSIDISMIYFQISKLVSRDIILNFIKNRKISVYDEAKGLYKIADGSIQHWSCLTMLEIKVRHPKKYNTILKKLDLGSCARLINKDMNGYFPDINLSDSEQEVLWLYYITNINEDPSYVSMIGSSVRDIQNNIQRDAKLRIKELELEIKILSKK